MIAKWAQMVRDMSPKRGFLFPEKSFSGFRGITQSGGHLIAVGPVVVGFIRIKIGPRIVIRLVGGFLPSGDAVCRFKRNISAKREYH